MATDKKDASNVVDLKKAGAAAVAGTPAKAEETKNAELYAPMLDASQDKDTASEFPAMSTRVLRVRAKGERFRRCGILFGRDESVLRIDALSDADVAALLAEPNLTVVEDVL